MSRTSSAASKAPEARTARCLASGNPPGFLSVAGTGVDDGFALPVIHPLSMTRRGLLALRRVNRAVLAQESERFPAPRRLRSAC